MRLGLVSGLLAVLVSGCATAPERMSLDDGQVLGACRAAAREYPQRSNATGPVVVRELISRSSADTASRLECTINFQTRQILSAAVDGVERLTAPEPL